MVYIICVFWNNTINEKWITLKCAFLMLSILDLFSFNIPKGLYRQRPGFPFLKCERALFEREQNASFFGRSYNVFDKLSKRCQFCWLVKCKLMFCFVWLLVCNQSCLNVREKSENVQLKVKMPVQPLENNGRGFLESFGHCF